MRIIEPPLGYQMPFIVNADDELDMVFFCLSLSNDNELQNKILDASLRELQDFLKANGFKIKRMKVTK